MKQARASDHWRGLGKRTPQNRIRSLAGASIINLPDAAISIPGAITIVTGLNGVGKSTLMHAVHVVLRRGAPASIENAALRASVGDLLCHLNEGTAILESRATLAPAGVTHSPSELPLNVAWIDPAFQVPALIQAFRDERNLGEALDQVEPRIYTADQVIELSHLVGKPYEDCSVYELENFAGREVCPYFWVKANGQEYGSEGMGVGEASLHYITWALTRLQTDSIVLLEEPETYVSARSQGAMMDRLAEVCLRKNCSAIVTTHSPHVFAKVPPAHTIILMRDAQGVKAVVKNSDRTRLLALSVPLLEEKNGVLLVEDRTAREFAKAWLTRFDPELPLKWRIVDHKSAGEVIIGLNNFPDAKNWFGAVGLLDGDERTKGHKASRPVCFLPGDKAPEVLLREAITAAPNAVADLLGVDTEMFAVAVSAVAGLEHHDWLIELVKSLKSDRVTFDRLVDAAFAVWATEKYNEGECGAALKALHAAIVLPA